MPVLRPGSRVHPQLGNLLSGVRGPKHNPGVLRRKLGETGGVRQDCSGKGSTDPYRFPVSTDHFPGTHPHYPPPSPTYGSRGKRGGEGWGRRHESFGGQWGLCLRPLRTNDPLGENGEEVPQRLPRPELPTLGPCSRARPGEEGRYEGHVRTSGQESPTPQGSRPHRNRPVSPFYPTRDTHTCPRTHTHVVPYLHVRTSVHLNVHTSVATVPTYIHLDMYTRPYNDPNSHNTSPSSNVRTRPVTNRPLP